MLFWIQSLPNRIGSPGSQGSYTEGMISNIPEKGFTLIELLVAMVAALVVLGAIAGNFIIQNNSYEQQAQVVQMHENARAGIQMMTRELLMAGYDPSGNANAGIVTAGADSINFTMDLNGDGDFDDSNENVTYALDTTDKQLTRKGTASDTADPLSEDIEGVSFTYYDANNAVTAVVGDIRRITIDLTARTHKPDPTYTPNSGYRTWTLTSDVRPRNIGL